MQSEGDKVLASDALFLSCADGTADTEGVGVGVAEEDEEEEEEPDEEAAKC